MIQTIYVKMFIWVLLLPLLAGCNRDADSAQSDTRDLPADSIALSLDEEADLRVLREAEIDSVASWLRTTVLKEDLEFIQSDERVFSLEKYDLNEDGKPEYFIGLLNDYFCGSGGCTYYILNHDGSVNSRFTVSHAPFQVLSNRTKGWHNLIINSSEGAHLLQYDGGSYPGNPTLLPDFQQEKTLDGTTVIDTVLGEGQGKFSY